MSITIQPEYFTSAHPCCDLEDTTPTLEPITVRHDDGTEWTLTQLPDGTFLTSRSNDQICNDVVDSLPDSLFAESPDDDNLYPYVDASGYVVHGPSNYIPLTKAEKQAEQTAKELQEAKAHKADADYMFSSLTIGLILFGIGYALSPEARFLNPAWADLTDVISVIGIACIAIPVLGAVGTTLQRWTQAIIK